MRVLLAAATCGVAIAAATPQPRLYAQPPAAASPSVIVRTAAVDGLTLQYLTAGHGPAVVLLHGYAETSRMWRPVMPRLAKTFTVIAPDLPGIGGSDIPADGLDMTRAAARIHALVKSLGIQKAAVVGHDIGLMVAYAYAAQFPDDTDKLVLMDAFLPGVEGWETIYNNPALWHFRFHGQTPEALVSGRERTYFDYYWNEFAADRKRSLSEADRRAYATAYARPGRMRAAWAYFDSFPQTAIDFARFARTPLPMPVLSIGGAKANGEALGRQVTRIASHAEAITLPDTGHWVMEERPHETADALVRFLTTNQTSLRGSTQAAPLRLTPDEIRARQTGSEQIGSSGLPGVTTQVLTGDPTRAAFYTIVLSVPPHTTILAHSHRDDRMATVISGTWQFGYGNRFDDGALKTLPPGSVYAEPAGTNHFARTLEDPVLVQITGVGPTDTQDAEVTTAPEAVTNRLRR
jgi:pimeloyl-ACP methyl ester carboxylesterase/quercetin dioxygenase-like cupin family protein